MYQPPETTNESRDFFRGFLVQVGKIVPVLKDPMLGCYPVSNDYADTELHLVPSAARKRSSELGRLLKNWETFTAAELSP